MKALLVTPEFGGKPYLLGPYTEEEARKKKEVMDGHKISVSMDFPRKISLNNVEIVEAHRI